MGATLQRIEMGRDRQFLDVLVELPDRRPGWVVALLAKGNKQVLTISRQPCSADRSLRACVRFYPFLEPGDYTLLARLIPPEADAESGEPKRVAHTTTELCRSSVPPLDKALAAEWLQQDGADLHQAASRALVPLCVDPQGTPCFWPVQGDSPNRVAVLSIPKAGTYLITKLLTNLGMVSCNVHVGKGLVGDYRISKQMPVPVQQHLDVAFSCRLVLAGQSMASHMRRELATEVALHHFGKLFVYRELRAALVSAFRAGARRTTRRMSEKKVEEPQTAQGHVDTAEAFPNWLRRGHLERMRRQYEGVSGWHDHPDACRVAFEDIMGDAGPERRSKVVAEIAAVCGVDLSDHQVETLLHETIGAETQTFSGARSTVDEYWSPEAEMLFQGAGLGKLNAMFGYDSAVVAAAA